MTGGPGPDDAVGVPELESVTGPAGRVEVIGDPMADDGPPAGERAAAWLRDRARRHPRVTAAVAALALVAALVPGGVAARRWLEGPQLPAGLQVSLDPGIEGDTPLWGTEVDGRPGGPPVLASTVGLLVPAGNRDGLVVTGLSGPGVVRDDGGPTSLAAGITVLRATVRPVLDCDRLPAAVTPAAYRVGLRVDSGGRQVARSVPVPESSGWVAAAQQACRTWRARRDLTVTALSADVDPTASRLTVTLTVRNTGRHPALFAPLPGACCGGSVGSRTVLTVPAGGAGTAGWPVRLDTCDSVSAGPGDGTPVIVDPVLSTQLGLAGLAGPDLPADLTGFVPPSGPAVEQVSPIGVPLDREAAATLVDGLRRACGRLSSPALLIAPRSVRLSRPAGRVTVDAVLDVTPGRVARVTLTTDPDGPISEEYRPLWTSIGPLVPDRTGQVAVRLTYRVTGSTRGCLPYGGVLPPMTFTLEVPEGDRVRAVRYSGMSTLTQDYTVIPRLCPGG